MPCARPNKSSTDRRASSGSRARSLEFEVAGSRSASRALIATAWPPGVRLEESCLVREHDCLHAVTELELLEYVRDVCLDGRVADVELSADLGVREAAGDQPKHL